MRLIKLIFWRLIDRISPMAARTGVDKKDSGSVLVKKHPSGISGFASYIVCPTCEKMVRSKFKKRGLCEECYVPSPPMCTPVTQTTDAKIPTGELEVLPLSAVGNGKMALPPLTFKQPVGSV